MSGRFEGRTVLISGGARGMGASHARGFAAEGAQVVIGDVLDDEGTATAAELGPMARYVHLDVSDEDCWAAAVGTAEETFGPLSVLVNNAGIGGVPVQLADTDTEMWRRVLAVNLDGSFFGIRAAVPSLRRAGGGAIVNISSFAGLVGTPLSGAYTTSKFALRGLTRVAAIELGPDNIRVNSVHPGYVNTPILGGLTPDQVVTGKLSLPRFAEPEEVTRMVLFVASDDASYSTGAEFVIDGGWSAGPPVAIHTSEPGVVSISLE